ncbi:MAG: hypothetical protein PHG25_02830 [Candidatus Pacebacteria bacterium]|nr:hypothetical protein [Candidatus Paceibacterota bacterium]
MDEEIIPDETRFSAGNVTFVTKGKVLGKEDMYHVLQSITGAAVKPKMTEMKGARVRQLIEEHAATKALGDMQTRSNGGSRGGSTRLTAAESYRARERRKGLLIQIHKRVTARHLSLSTA